MQRFPKISALLERNGLLGVQDWRRPGSVQRAAFGAISAGLAGQAALVLSGVVFARVLGPQGRGDLALVLLLPAIVYQLGNLGLPLATAYFIAKEAGQTAPIVRQIRTFAIL